MSWHRPYGALAGSVVWLLAEFVVPPAFAFELVLVFARPSWPVVAEVLLGGLILVTPLTVRASLLGVYVSRHGLRVRRMLRTETVAWADVTGVRADRAMLGPVDLDRDAIVVTATGGRVLRSPVQAGSIVVRPVGRLGLNYSARMPAALGQLLVARDGFDGIVRILRDRLVRENPGAASASAPPAVPGRSAADAAVLARKRARGEVD